MAGSRTLKLSILADIDDLKKNLNQGSDEVQGFGGKLEKFSGMAKAAFAAAGAAAVAYAGKLAIDGVKAAIEDEAAQVRLANALKNTVGATKEQISATESFILKTSLATGKADDELRPAFERLTRSTKDIAEAQKLTNLALDIAAAKNISVETAANALAKANDGQVGALKKLGITLGDNASNLVEYNKVQKALEKAQLEANFALEQYGPKSKEYIKASEKVAEVSGKANEIAMQGIDVFGELGKEFAGASTEAANTFAGRMERLKVTFDEAKETVGAKLLPILEFFLNLVINDIVPNLGKFAEMFKPITDAIVNNKETFKDFGKFLVDYVVPILVFTLGNALKAVGKIANGIIEIIGGVISAVTKAVNAAISAINKVIEAYNKIPFLPDLPTIGGSQKPSTSTTKGPDAARAGAVNITINGAIDPAGTARQIAGLLKTEASTSGSFNTLGLSTFA